MNKPDHAYIDIVFTRSPGNPAPEFVEIENEKGESISLGTWVKRPDGYDVLRIRPDAFHCDYHHIVHEQVEQYLDALYRSGLSTSRVKGVLYDFADTRFPLAKTTQPMKTYTVKFTLEEGTKIQAEDFNDASRKAREEAVRLFGETIADQMSVTIEGQ